MTKIRNIEKSAALLRLWQLREKVANLNLASANSDLCEAAARHAESVTEAHIADVKMDQLRRGGDIPNAGYADRLAKFALHLSEKVQDSSTAKEAAENRAISARLRRQLCEKQSVKWQKMRNSLLPGSIEPQEPDHPVTSSVHSRQKKKLS